MLKHSVRIGRIAAGTVLIVVGAVLSLPLVPGPGLLLVVFGLGFLSHEFEWARKLRDWSHREFKRLIGRDHGR